MGDEPRRARVVGQFEIKSRRAHSARLWQGCYSQFETVRIGMHESVELSEELGMKTLLLTSVALFGLTATAMAADLPRRVAPAPPPVAVPVFTWTGFYVGVNAGYGFGIDDDSVALDLLSNLTVPAIRRISVFEVVTETRPVRVLSRAFGAGRDRQNDGFVGGGQIGYNWQLTPGAGLVLGLEADIQFADFGGRDRSHSGNMFGSPFLTSAPELIASEGAGIGPPLPGALGNIALFRNAFPNSSVDRSHHYFGTVRGRLGYAFGRLLLFATGGLAFTDEGRQSNVPFGFVNGASVPDSFLFRADPERS